MFLLGALSACSGHAAVLHYTALGDSITYGDASYVSKFQGDLNRDIGVRVAATNLGVPAMTSSQLLDKLRTDQNYRKAVKQAKLVSVFIGFNDFAIGSALYDQGRCGGPDAEDCMRTIASNFAANLRDIISIIRDIQPDPNLVIILSDLYDPWIDRYKASGTIDVLVPFMNRMNQALHSVAASEGLHVANVYEAFNGPDGLEDPVQRGYIRDGVHPSDAGQAVIAAQFRDLEPDLIPLKDAMH